jgi:cell division protein FtsB
VRRLLRLLVALLALLAVLFIAGFPARTYLDQQGALASTSERLEVLRKSNKELEARSKELHSDAAVERLAREQYNLVRPGEEAYAILPGPNAAKPSADAPKAAKATHRGGFFARVWDDITFWS